jgi:hypothetical protein
MVPPSIRLGTSQIQQVLPVLVPTSGPIFHHLKHIRKHVPPEPAISLMIITFPQIPLGAVNACWSPVGLLK